jgi:hypothetical protein
VICHLLWTFKDTDNQNAEKDYGKADRLQDIDCVAIEQVGEKQDEDRAEENEGGGYAIVHLRLGPEVVGHD